MSLLLLLAAVASAQPSQPSFEQAVSQTPALRPSLKRLARDVEAIAEDLEKVRVRTLTVEALSEGLVKKVQSMKASGRYAKELDPVFDRLQAMYEALPNRYYTAYSPRQAFLSSVRQLQYDAKEASGAADLLARLGQSLSFPLEIESEGAKGLLPTKMTLDRYLRKGPILIFIMKHRLSKPKEYAEMTEDEFIAKVKAGEPVLGTGIVVRGTVTWAGSSIDLDKTWNHQTIHLEITPETWLFRGLRPPKAGDYVEIQGWTYYDMFHTDEEEAEGDSEFEGNRPTVCEVHPATKVTILHAAK